MLLSNDARVLRIGKLCVECEQITGKEGTARGIATGRPILTCLYVDDVGRPFVGDQQSFGIFQLLPRDIEALLEILSRVGVGFVAAFVSILDSLVSKSVDDARGNGRVGMYEGYLQYT